MSGHHHYTTKGYNGTNQRSAQHDRHDSSGKHRSGWGADREKTTYRVPRPDFESMADQGSRTSQKRKAYMRQHTDTASKRPRYEGQQYGSKEVSHRNNFKIRKKANNIEVGELGRPSTSGAAAPEKPSNIPSPYAHLPPSPPRLSKPTTMDRNMRSLQPPPPAMGNFSQTLNSTTKCADNSQNENQCNTGNDKRYGEISENFNKNAQHIGNSENNGKSGHIPEMAKPTDTASAADENESTKFFNSKASTTKASNKADNNTLNLNDGNFTKSENIDTIARKNSERTEQKFKTPKNHSITCNKSTSNFQLFPINLNIPALSDIGSVSTTQTLGIANTNRKRTSRFSEDTLKTDNMPGNKDVHLINNLSPFGNMGNSEGDLLHNRFNNNTGLSRQLPESAKGNYLPGNNAAASHISDVSRFENKGNSEGASNNRFNNNTGNCQQFPESAKSNNAPEKKDTQLKNDLPHFGNNGNGENAANNRYNNNTVNFQPFPKRNYLPGKSGTQNKNDLPRFGNNGNSEGSINNRFISNTGNFQPFPESAKSNYLPGKMDTRAKNDLPHVGNNGNTEGPINNRFNNSGKFQQMTETVRSSYFPGKKDARPINDFGNNGNSEGPINNNTGNFQQMPETVRSNYLSDKKDARPINDLPRFENNANSGDAVNNRFNNTGNFQQFPESAKGNYMSSNKDMRPINNVTRFGNNENVGVTDSNSSKNNIGNFQQFPETVKSSIFSSKMDVRPINDTTRFGSNENVVANDNNSSKNNTGNFQQLPKSSKSNYLSGNMNECASNHLRHFANNGYSESGVNNRFNNSTGHFPLFPNKTNPNYPSISGNMMRHTENYTSSVASKEKEYDDSNMSFPKNNWNFRIYDKQFCKPSPSPDYRNNNQVGGGGFTQQYGNTGISSNNNGAAVTNTGNFYKAITENNQQVAAKQNIENNIYKSKNNVPRKTRFDMGPAVIEKITNKTIEQNNNMVGNNENKEISSDSAGSRPCTGNTVNDKIFQQNENKLETFNQFPHGNETKTDYQTTGNNNAPPPPTAQPLYGNTESELGKNIQFGMKRRTNHRFFGKEMNHGHFNQFENNKNHSENSTQLFGSNNNHYCNVQQLPPSDSGFQINPLLLGGSGVMGGNQRFYEDINPAPPVEDCNNKNMENNCSNFHQQNRNNNHGNKVAHGFHKFGSNMRNIQRFGNNLEAAGQMRQFRNNNGPPQHFDINKNRQFARNSGQSRGRGGRGNFNQRGPKNNSNRAQSGFNTSQRFEANQNAVTSQRFVGNANKLKRPLLKNSKRGGGGGGIKQKSFAKTLQNKFGKLLRKTKNVKIKPKITPAAKKEKKAAAMKLKKTKPDDGTDKKSSEDEHIDVNKEIFGDFQPIAVGLKKPAKGHLKPEPEEYWKQWWSLYGYVEKILPPPPTDPNEESLIKSFLHFQLTPSDAEFRRRKRILMVMGVAKILRHIRLNEKDYALRDIFNVLKYKHQLEDPQLHQHLAPKELERVQMVLKNAQKKTRRALFYQSMICRWHFSTVIIKRAENGESLKCGHAQKLIGNKVFNYLVWESIQELKKLILDDWPGFEEFYKTL